MGTTNDMTVVNQFGEKSIDQVNSVSAAMAAKVMASATAVSVTGKLLTGFVSGAGTVAATDTVLQGINKLSGNTQNRAVTANLLTGLAVGANSTILSTDTILAALAKLQAQIDAL
jgi:hypothetical protein